MGKSMIKMYKRIYSLIANPGFYSLDILEYFHCLKTGTQGHGSANNLNNIFLTCSKAYVNINSICIPYCNPSKYSTNADSEAIIMKNILTMQKSQVLEVTAENLLINLVKEIAYQRLGI